MKLLRCNRKQIGIPFLILAMLSPLLCLVACCNTHSSPIIPLRSITPWTKDELKEVYWEYKEELNEVTSIVLGSETFRQRSAEEMIYMEISSNYRKDDFTEEEWSKIVDLFEKIRPSEITCHTIGSDPTGRGDDVLVIYFGSRRVSDGRFITSLEYYSTPEAAELKLSHTAAGESLEHVDRNWYIRERFSKD